MSSSLVINKAVPNAREYYPLNEPAIGTIVNHDAQKPLLFGPLTLRGTTFKNRVWVSPMAQYSSDDGHATDWHLVHLGTFATHGAGAITMEANAVLPEGRIAPEDAEIFNPCALATNAAWEGWEGYRRPGRAGWPDEVYGPSNISFNRGKYPDPKEMTEEYINKLTDAFVESARRADKAGLDFIEIQAAHGYLLHSFLSPLSNLRTDIYGGQPIENRLRVTLNIVKKVRESWPSHKPLFVRISATDWAEGPEKDADGKWLQWGLEQSTILSEKLGELGVDLIDISTGGNWVAQGIPVGHGYQVPFAAELKKALPSMAFGTVGAITEPERAEAYLQQGNADVVFMARELLRNPAWPLYAAQTLGATLKPANQYEMAWPAPIPSPISPSRVRA